MTARFAIFIGIVQTILWLGHAVLYVTAVTFLPISGPIVEILLAALSLTFVTANLLAFRSDNLIARAYYLFAAVWLGLGHYLLIAAVVVWVTYGVVSLLSPPVPTVWLGILGLTVALALAIYSLANARTLRVTHYQVKLPQLPESWRGRRAVWASDIHLGHINRHGYARKVARKIGSLKPDIVFIGGDLFDGVDFGIKSLLEPLSGVKAPRGTYFITGNHEEFGDPSRFVTPIREAGLTVLLNERVEIDGLQLIGVDYAGTASRKGHEEILRRLQIDPSRPSILLMHSPSHLQVSEAASVSLQISGHTHRGQLWPFSGITRRLYGGFDYGLKRYGNMQVITSSGAGTWGPPMRSGSPTEIVAIEFV